MPTDVTSTIGSSGRDYSTLQAWEDACPANLVTDDKRWIGNCYNDSEFTSSGTLLTVGGITTDSTRYVYLKCATGQSFSDNASVRANALDYNQSNGVGIRCTGGGYTTGVSCSISYTRFEGLQFYHSGGTGSSRVMLSLSGTSVIVDSCIAKGGQFCVYGDFIIRNCLVLAAQYGCYGVNGYSCYGATVVNNSVYGTSRSSGYTGIVLVNCAVFGNATAFHGSAGQYSGTDYVATDAGSVPAGTHNQVSLTFADQFESTTNDFRAKSTGDLQAGTPDSTNTPDDITGLTRDATTPWIGCWEVAGGGGHITVTPTTLALTLTTFAPTVTTPRLCTPTTLSLTLTTFAPTVSAPRLCTPTTATLTLSTFAPTVSAPRLCTPTTLALSLTTFAPTVSAPRVCTPTTKVLTLTTFAPTVTASEAGTVTPTTATLVTTRYAPTIYTPRLIVGGTLAISISTYAPTVSTGVPSVTPTLSIEVPLTVRRSLQRAFDVCRSARLTTMAVRTTAEVGVTVRTSIDLAELPAGAEE